MILGNGHFRTNRNGNIPRRNGLFMADPKILCLVQYTVPAP